MTLKKIIIDACADVSDFKHGNVYTLILILILIANFKHYWKEGNVSSDFTDYPKEFFLDALFLRIVSLFGFLFFVQKTIRS